MFRLKLRLRNQFECNEVVIDHRQPQDISRDVGVLVFDFGCSLGGAIGAWLGAHNDPAAVIIESSFSSGADMAKRIYPFLPARLVTRLRYPVVEYAKSLTCPVLVIHSRHDEIIPFDMGLAIYDAVKQHKTFLEISGDHNNGFMISRADYTAAIQNFIETGL